MFGIIAALDMIHPQIMYLSWSFLGLRASTHTIRPGLWTVNLETLYFRRIVSACRFRPRNRPCSQFFLMPANDWFLSESSFYLVSLCLRRLICPH